MIQSLASKIESLEQSEGSGKLPHIWRKIWRRKRKAEKAKAVDMMEEYIKDALNKASSMYPYEVVGKPETYSLYNAGWQDAIDYVSQLLWVDVD